MRVLIAVTHLLGAGHLTRAAALARAFARAGHETTLVSGGRPASHVKLEGVRLIQLPPVQVTGTDFTTLLDLRGRLADAARLAERIGLMAAALERMGPDVVVTELFPFGRRVLAGEFLALVECARAMRPRPLVLSSVRDILVAPAKPHRVEETHVRLRALYDAVLVHGDPEFIALDTSWPVDEALRSLIRYTGYVDDGEGASAGDLCGDVSEIVVSGGSSAASLPLYQAALGAAALLPEHRWRVLVGNGVPQPAFAALAAAAPHNTIVERARHDFRALLRSVRLSVSQAGYNTVVDLLRARTPAVLVPFEAGRETEQRLRAERLAQLNFASVLPEQELSAAALAWHAADGLARPRPCAPAVRLDGADRTVTIVEALTSCGHGSTYPPDQVRDRLSHPEEGTRPTPVAS